MLGQPNMDTHTYTHSFKLTVINNIKINHTSKAVVGSIGGYIQLVKMLPILSSQTDDKTFEEVNSLIHTAVLMMLSTASKR